MIVCQLHSLVKGVRSHIAQHMPGMYMCTTKIPKRRERWRKRDCSETFCIGDVCSFPSLSSEHVSPITQKRLRHDHVLLRSAVSISHFLPCAHICTTMNKNKNFFFLTKLKIRILKDVIIKKLGREKEPRQ